MSTNQPSVSKKNNFDFIRLFAAVLVFIEHAGPIFTGKTIPFDVCRFLFGYSYGATGILIFFSISGFLVAHSYLTTQHWLKFMVKRILRIWPALVFNILITILVLGLFFSALRFEKFLAHRDTFLYLENILIFRNYYFLPGVFDSSLHSPSVNGSLWTIPYEFTCYLILSFLFLVNFIKRKWIFLTLGLLIWIIYLLFQDNIDMLVIPILGITFKSLMLPLLFFLSGVCFYLFKDHIRLNAFTLAWSVVGVLGIMLGWLPRELMIVILPLWVFAFAFSTRIRLYTFARYGDLSYGFYLYAYPVKQCVAQIGLRNEWSFLLLFVVAFTITLVIAFISWHLIEKPCLKLKTLFKL